MSNLPQLSAPPLVVINDMERRCKVDKREDVCLWIKELARDYQKREVKP